MSKSIGDLKGRITMEGSDFKAKMQDARDELKKTAMSSENLKRDFSNIGKASAVVGGAVVAAVGAATKVAMDFEKQMSRVKAISGATDIEWKQLKQSALELGASTSKSASEVAIGMEDLAAMGFSVNEILGAMPGVISAAEASGADMAQTASIMASAINIFGLEAKEASRVADILAETANVSAADITDMGYALKYAGPPAAALGYTLEDVSAAIGIMTNAGMEGSQAGTSLRAALLALNNPAKAQAKIMERIGFTMQDASGEAKGLSTVIAELEESTRDMTEADKVATLAKLVGTEAVSGLLSLMKAGPEEIDRFSESLRNSAGASKQAADVMMDNLYGAVEEFGGAMETLGIQVGDELLPIFKDLVIWAADLVNGFAEIDSKSIVTTAAFIGITAAVAGAIAVVGKLAMALSAFALTPVGAAIIGVSLLAGIIGSQFVSAQMKGNEVTLEHAESLQAEHDQLENNINMYDQYKSRLKLSTDELARFVDISDLLKQTADPEIIKRLSDEQKALQEKSGLTNEEMSEFIRLNDEIVETVPGANVTITDQGNALLGTTDAAKAYNAETRRMIQLELEAQLAQAEANYEENLRKQEKAKKDINKAQERANELQKMHNEAVMERSRLEAEYQRAKESGDTLEAERLENKISQQDRIVNGTLEEIAKQRGLLVEKQKELDKINEELGKLDQVRQKMVDIELEQVGLNAKKGDGIKAIDSEITKLQQQRRELEKNTPPAQRQTEAYRDAVAQIDRQVDRLEAARRKVVDITKQAGTMNAALGRSITKDVIIRQVEGQTLKRMPDLDYHTGGLVGREPMPKLHVGGTVASILDRLRSTPMHNELDVRLLKNEMVLTESQQANLMRIIDAGHTNRESGTVTTSGAQVQVTNHIVVEGNLDSELYDQINSGIYDDAMIKNYVNGVNG